MREKCVLACVVSSKWDNLGANFSGQRERDVNRLDMDLGKGKSLNEEMRNNDSEKVNQHHRCATMRLLFGKSKLEDSSSVSDVITCEPKQMFE